MVEESGIYAVDLPYCDEVFDSSPCFCKKFLVCFYSGVDYWIVDVQDWNVVFLKFKSEKAVLMTVFFQCLAESYFLKNLLRNHQVVGGEGGVGGLVTL